MAADEIEIRPLQEAETQVAKENLTWFAAWSALFASFSGLFMYGYAIGSINAASVSIKHSIQDNYQHRYNETLSQDALNRLWVLTGAAFPLGGILGVMSLNALSKRFNRVSIMTTGHAVMAVLGVFVALSNVLKAHEIVIIFRFISGAITSCVGTGVSTMYIVEIVPKSWRGVFSSTVTVFIGVGIFFGNLLGLPQILGNVTRWPYFLAISSVPSCVYLFFSPFISRSPRYMYMQTKDCEGVRKILQKLRGNKNVDKEVDELIVETKNQQNAKFMSVFGVLRNKLLRWQLLSAVVVGMAQQTTGLNGVSYQLNDIFLNAGIPSDVAPYCSVGLTGLNSLFAIASTIIVKFKGRKKLLVTGYLLEGLFLVILALSIILQPTVPEFGYISFVGSFGYFVAFFIGPAPCTFLVMTEFFDQFSRSAGMTVGVCFSWVAFTLVVVITPYMLAAMGGYAFVPYAVIAWLSALYIYTFVPETRNRTFTEIQRRFSERSMRRNQSSTVLGEKKREKFICTES